MNQTQQIAETTETMFKSICVHINFGPEQSTWMSRTDVVRRREQVSGMCVWMSVCWCVSAFAARSDLINLRKTGMERDDVAYAGERNGVIWKSRSFLFCLISFCVFSDGFLLFSSFSLQLNARISDRSWLNETDRPEHRENSHSGWYPTNFELRRKWRDARSSSATEAQACRHAKE
jgi:hypothetical protein